MIIRAPRGDAFAGSVSRRLVLLTAALAAAWTTGVFLVPYLEAGDPSATGATAGLLRLAYGPLCHQDPGRSLSLGGHALAVCSRCTGIYLGGVAGLLVMGLVATGRRRAPHPVWLLAAAAPTMIDLGTRVVGLPGLADLPRLAAAVPLGLVLGLFLGEGVADLGRMISENQSGAALARATGSGPRLETGCD